MNTDVLTTRVADGIAVITLGSAQRIYFDAEMGDALTATLDGYRRGSQYSRRGSDGRRARVFRSPLFYHLSPAARRAPPRFRPRVARQRDLQRRIFRQGHGALREHAKTSNRRHFRNLFWPAHSSSRFPAICASPRMATT